MKAFIVRYQTKEGRKRKEGFKTTTINAKDKLEAAEIFLTVSQEANLDVHLTGFKIGES